MTDYRTVEHEGQLPEYADVKVEMGPGGGAHTETIVLFSFKGGSRVEIKEVRPDDYRLPDTLEISLRGDLEREGFAMAMRAAADALQGRR